MIYKTLKNFIVISLALLAIFIFGIFAFEIMIRLHEYFNLTLHHWFFAAFFTVFMAMLVSFTNLQ